MKMIDLPCLGATILLQCILLHRISVRPLTVGQGYETWHFKLQWKYANFVEKSRLRRLDTPALESKSHSLRDMGQWLTTCWCQIHGKGERGGMRGIQSFIACRRIMWYGDGWSKSKSGFGFNSKSWNNFRCSATFIPYHPSQRTQHAVKISSSHNLQIWIYLMGQTGLMARRVRLCNPFIEAPAPDVTHLPLNLTLYHETIMSSRCNPFGLIPHLLEPLLQI